MISRAVNHTSVFISINSGHASTELGSFRGSSARLNRTAIVRYLSSDNLVSCSPFQTIFEDVRRIPPGAVLRDCSDDKMQLSNDFDFTINERLSAKHFVVNKQNSSLLFSGGIDSSILLACNPWLQALYHINYHGKGSRTNEIAKFIAELFGRELISVDPAIDEFDLEEYVRILGHGLTGIQSPLQYCFNIELKKQVLLRGGGDLLSGQNVDTMLYVDHYHPPTQLILHERIPSIISGVKKRIKMWGRFDSTLLDATKVALMEHLGQDNEFQQAVLKKYRFALHREFDSLAFPSIDNLALLKLIRWFRGGASVNDNFKILQAQTGLSRVAALNNKDFINCAIAFKPERKNYFFCKAELSLIFKEITGLNHRTAVTRAIVESSTRLAQTKTERASILESYRDFNHRIITQLFRQRKESLAHTISAIDVDFLSDRYKNLLRSDSFSLEDYVLIHKLINLDIFINNKPSSVM